VLDGENSGDSSTGASLKALALISRHFVEKSSLYRMTIDLYITINDRGKVVGRTMIDVDR